jgi:hypothetical protein
MTVDFVPAQPCGYITARLDDPAALVAQYRANANALRRLRISRLSPNSGAGDSAIARREHDQHLAEVSAHAFGTTAQKALLGALADEREVRARLLIATRHGQSRPELEVRLKNNRKAINELIKRINIERRV